MASRRLDSTSLAIRLCALFALAVVLTMLLAGIAGAQTPGGAAIVTDEDPIEASLLIVMPHKWAHMIGIGVKLFLGISVLCSALANRISPSTLIGRGVHLAALNLAPIQNAIRDVEETLPRGRNTPANGAGPHYCVNPDCPGRAQPHPPCGAVERAPEPEAPTAGLPDGQAPHLDDDDPSGAHAAIAQQIADRRPR